MCFFTSPPIYAGAAIFPLSTGYVYVSNSEIQSNGGGVYGLYFDNKGSVVDYKVSHRNVQLKN